jgi:hypothetical protein
MACRPARNFSTIGKPTGTDLRSENNEIKHQAHRIVAPMVPRRRLTRRNNGRRPSPKSRRHSASKNIGLRSAIHRTRCEDACLWLDSKGTGSLEVCRYRSDVLSSHRRCRYHKPISGTLPCILAYCDAFGGSPPSLALPFMPLTSHARADLAFKIVSAVVKVLEMTSTSVVSAITPQDQTGRGRHGTSVQSSSSKRDQNPPRTQSARTHAPGSRPSVARATSTGSTLARKRSRRPAAAAAAAGSDCDRNAMMN